jgi:hypothetical protein
MAVPRSHVRTGRFRRRLAAGQGTWQPEQALDGWLMALRAGLPR